jgi:hypothetical protein
MSDLRSLAQLRTDAYRLCDVENAVARFPASEVTDYVNRGIERVYAEMMKAWAQPFYIVEAKLQLTPAPFGEPQTAPLPMNYLQMVGISWSAGPLGPWHPLDPYQDEGERTRLLSGAVCGVAHEFRWGFAAAPAAFTQGIPPTTYSIEVLPRPPQGSFLRIRYVPSFQPLVNDGDSFDGILGFWDAASTWAAILMRRKDDLDTSALQSDWSQHLERIQSIARRRDRSRPPQVQIVANWGSGRMRGHRGRW